MSCANIIWHNTHVYKEVTLEAQFVYEKTTNWHHSERGECFFFFLRWCTREQDVLRIRARQSVWHRLNLADNATARNKKPGGVRGSKNKRTFILSTQRETRLLASKKYTYVPTDRKIGSSFDPIVCAAATTSRENRCKSDRDVNKARRCIPKLLVRSARAWIHAACGYNKSVKT